MVHGITGHKFETRHPSDDSDQVWFPLVSYFQRRRFFKKFTTYDDDGRQVMGIAHMTLWVRWAKKKCEKKPYFCENMPLWHCWKSPCHPFTSPSRSLREKSSLPVFYRCLSVYTGKINKDSLHSDFIQSCCLFMVQFRQVSLHSKKNLWGIIDQN